MLVKLEKILTLLKNKECGIILKLLIIEDL